MLIENPKPVNLEDLARICDPAYRHIKRLILHWTAGRYGQQYDDYHINIDRDGEVYLTCEDLTDLKAHTWMRNTGSVGITLDCCYDAVAYVPAEGTKPDIDFGPYPPTQKQIDAMAMVIAVLANELCLAINEDTVFTHAEAAIKDGYGIDSNDPEIRWDLLYLPDSAYNNELREGGKVLRGKAIWYRNLQHHPPRIKTADSEGPFWRT